jgi:hypothetical protein
MVMNMLIPWDTASLFDAVLPMSQPVAGGAMSGSPYSTIPGWVTVTEVRMPGPRGYNLGDSVEVSDFEPDDGDARREYAFSGVDDHAQRLTVGSGANPSRGWAERMGLHAGSRHRCVGCEPRRDVTAPVILEFPAVDDAVVQAAYEEGGT